MGPLKGQSHVIFRPENNFDKYKYSAFNKSIDNLPSHLTHILFSNGFNQNITNLPTHLTYLIFGNKFSKREFGR